MSGEDVACGGRAVGLPFSLFFRECAAKKGMWYDEGLAPDRK